MTPRHVRPILASALSITLLALSLAGPAGAANSRDLIIGTSTGGNGIPDADGVLVPTPVTAGGVTSIEVAIASQDNQTIANAVLYFPGIGATGLRDSLPTDAKIIGVFGPDSAGCAPAVSPATPADSVSCGLGNIAAYGMRDVSFIVSVPTAASSGNLFSASVETNNENGSNNQIFTASSGTFAIQPFNPDSVATFIPPGQLKATHTAAVGVGNNLQTTIEFVSSTNGDTVSIAEANSASGPYTCPPGLTCQPDYTTVSIDNGGGNFSQAPYLKWDLIALVPGNYNINKAFVAHYPSGGSTYDWILYWKNSGDRCGSDIGATISTNHHCIASATLGKTDKGTGLAQLEFIVYSDGNGGMRY